MFTFKLWSQGHTISDVSYIDTSSKKHVFPNVTITLDQKEEQLKELSVSSSEPELRYRYDFKNFFETTFLMGNTNSSSSSQQSTSTSGDTPSKSMTPEMQIFIQNELVEKDFKNIVAFLPISFNNIYATIQNGNYAIDLSAIKKTFQGKDNAYPVELSGKYVFDRHAFYKLNFQLHEPD